MTSLLWASLIIPPAALVCFVPCWTYLYLVGTGRTLRPGWMRSLVMSEGGRPEATRWGTILSITIAATAQILVTVVIVEGLRQVPVVPLAVLAGGAEWLLAIAWALLLVRHSSPIA
jgi:hypothetical protein